MINLNYYYNNFFKKKHTHHNKKKNKKQKTKTNTIKKARHRISFWRVHSLDALQRHFLAAVARLRPLSPGPHSASARPDGQLCHQHCAAHAQQQALEPPAPAQCARQTPRRDANASRSPWQRAEARAGPRARAAAREHGLRSEPQDSVVAIDHCCCCCCCCYCYIIIIIIIIIVVVVKL